VNLKAGFLSQSKDLQAERVSARNCISIRREDTTYDLLSALLGRSDAHEREKGAKPQG